ncbi:MAG: hypothetical protein JKY93_01720 [Gammaproteobacteria bacterium]|nr:hypothetical protein [Gammaproteobacteria bacterium]
MKVYNFNPDTNEYSGESDAQVDVLKTQIDQVIRFLLTASATYIAPPPVGVDEVAVFGNDQWSVMVTHVGKVVYDVLTREPKQVLSRGPVPNGYTLTPPPTIYSVWENQGWVSVELVGVLSKIPSKLLEIKAACENAIVSGFSSSALGVAHYYQSDRDDQINLIGAALANIDRPYRCTDDQSIDQFWPHTALQLQQVLADGAVAKQTYLEKTEQLKNQIHAAQTFAALDAIVW